MAHLLSSMTDQRQMPASSAALRWPEHGRFNAMFVPGIKALWETESCVTAPVRKLNGDEKLASAVNMLRFDPI